MEIYEVRRFDLQARDDQQLQQRLTTFRQAVKARNGAIIDVRWVPLAPLARCGACVTYELLVGKDAPARAPLAGGGAP